MTTFGDGADFTGATFGLGSNFDGASLGAFAFFPQAFFGPGACFRNAVFGNAADFSTTTFEGPSHFTAATFGDGASFAAAAIGDTAHFEQTHFKGPVSFAGSSTKQWAKRFVRRQGTTEEAHAERERRHKESWETDGSGPDRFLRISFADARFDDKVNFSGRSFESKANCIGTQFHSPPDFDRATNASRIDFTGAHIGFGPPGTLVHWTEDSDIPFQLRAFRKIVEETKNHDLERDLYIEERKAERGVYWHQLFEELKKSPWREKPLISGRLLVHALWIIVMFFYWVLSNYGRSFLAPAIWLSLSVPFFYWRYSNVLASLMHEAGLANADKYKHLLRMLALGNAVPFVGPLTIDADIKKFLFCPGISSCLPIPPRGYQMLVVEQNLLSIILVFFIGLALRNYFKIK